MLIRSAKPEDAMSVARVHVRSWQAAYRGLLPDVYLDQLQPEDRAARYDFSGLDPLTPETIIAEEDGVIAGFATTGTARDSDLPNAGELFALYVDPAYWGVGYGAALMQRACERLVETGFQRAALWTLAGNARVDRFYRTDGWVPDGKEKSDVLWGITVNEVRYRRELTALDRVSSYRAGHMKS